MATARCGKQAQRAEGRQAADLCIAATAAENIAGPPAACRSGTDGAAHIECGAGPRSPAHRTSGLLAAAPAPAGSQNASLSWCQSTGPQLPSWTLLRMRTAPSPALPCPSCGRSGARALDTACAPGAASACQQDNGVASGPPPQCFALRTPIPLGEPHGVARVRHAMYGRFTPQLGMSAWGCPHANAPAAGPRPVVLEGRDCDLERAQRLSRRQAWIPTMPRAAPALAAVPRQWTVCRGPRERHCRAECGRTAQHLARKVRSGGRMAVAAATKRLFSAFALRRPRIQHEPPLRSDR